MFTHGKIIKTDSKDDVKVRIQNNNNSSNNHSKQEQRHINIDQNIESKNLFQKDNIGSLLKKTKQDHKKFNNKNSNRNTKFIQNNSNHDKDNNNKSHSKYNNQNNNNTYVTISNIRNRRSYPFGDTCNIEKLIMTDFGPCNKTVTINFCSGNCRYVPIPDNYTSPIPSNNSNNTTITKSNTSTDGDTCWERACVADQITTVQVQCDKATGGLTGVESAVSCSCIYQKCSQSLLLQHAQNPSKR